MTIRHSEERSDEESPPLSEDREKGLASLKTSSDSYIKV